MAKGTLVNFVGVVTPNVDIVPMLRDKELSLNPEGTLQFSPLVLKKIGIKTDAGTVVKINGRDIEIVFGTLELGYGLVDIYSLIFSSPVNVCIYYVY